MAENTSNARDTGSNAESRTRLSPAAKDLLQDQANGRPVWIRSPKQGVDFYTGFSRARLYAGAADGDFRSVSIRKPGQTKGTRLFHLQSILDFISKCEQDAVKQGTVKA